jgi:hypothetical protein
MIKSSGTRNSVESRRIEARAFQGTEVRQCSGTDDSAAISEAVRIARSGWIIIANGQTCAGADITIPNLRIEKGGLLKPTTSHAITLAGDFDAGPYQAFTNALPGQGTISFGANSSVSTLYPQWWGARNDDTTDNVSAFAAVKATWQAMESNNRTVEIVFPAGVYKISTGQNWYGSGITLRALGRVIIKATGTSGNIVEFDAGAGGNGYRARMVGDFVLDGSGKAQVGLYTRNTHHSEFSVQVRNVTSAGLKTEGAVLNDYKVQVTAAGDRAFTVAPVNGAVLGRSTLISSTIACRFRLVIENATGTGVVLSAASGNAFSGTAEGLGGWGVQIAAGSDNNNFEGFFCEQNKLGDFEVSGSLNHFDNCTGSSIGSKAPIFSIKGIVFKAGAKMNKWTGGYFYAGLVEAGADSNQFLGFQSNYKVFDEGKNTLRWGLELYNSAAILPPTLPVLSRPEANAAENSLQSRTLPVYRNNAAAIAGGLAAGSLYRTGGDPDLISVVH